MIKRFFFSAFLCAVCMFAMAQSQTVTHVVQRGETLESIAEYYKVSVDDINKANPNADGMVYVGMKLSIPIQKHIIENIQKTSSKDDVFVQSSNSSMLPTSNAKQITKEQEKGATTNLLTTSTHPNTEEEKYSKEDWDVSMQIALFLGSLTGDGAECFKNTWSMSAALGAKYFMVDNVYVEALIGYKGLVVSWKKDYVEALFGEHATGNLDTHSIYSPLYLGVKFDNLSIKAGPYFDYIVSGKQEIGVGSKKLKTKIEADRLSFGLNLAVQYKGSGLNFKIGLSDYAGIKKCKEMAIGFYMGF